MKIKGAELLHWMEEAWPGDDWYWDHECFEEPEAEVSYDTEEIGPIFYQGNDEDPTEGEGYNLGALISKWRKDRKFKTLVLTVPVERLDEISSLLQSQKIKFS